MAKAGFSCDSDVNGICHIAWLGLTWYIRPHLAGLVILPFGAWVKIEFGDGLTFLKPMQNWIVPPGFGTNTTRPHHLLQDSSMPPVSNITWTSCLMASHILEGSDHRFSWTRYRFCLDMVLHEMIPPWLGDKHCWENFYKASHLGFLFWVEMFPHLYRVWVQWSGHLRTGSGSGG